MSNFIKPNQGPSIAGERLIEVYRSLDFNGFQAINRNRHLTSFRKRCLDWGLVDWSNAIAAEAGELCGKVKEVRRGDVTLEQQREEILKELADVITYADAMISYLGANTEQVLVAKFNEVSARDKVNYPPLRIVRGSE